MVSKMKVFGHLVQNGRFPFTINITKEDNENGIPGDEENCAAALATLRVPHITRSLIGRSVTYVEVDGKETFRYKTPNAIKLQYIAYDKTKKFDEGVYDITPFPKTRQTRKDAWKIKDKIKREEMKKEEVKIAFRPLAPSDLPTGKRMGGETKSPSKRDGSRKALKHEISGIRGRIHWRDLG